MGDMMVKKIAKTMWEIFKIITCPIWVIPALAWFFANEL
jgi:hypothetical protein